MRIEHGAHRPGSSVSPPNSLPAARANGGREVSIARRAVGSEYLAGRVWSTADVEPEEPGGSGSHPHPGRPGELVASIETGRPVLDWTSLCDREYLRRGLCECLAQSERHTEEKVVSFLPETIP